MSRRSPIAVAFGNSAFILARASDPEGPDKADAAAECRLLGTGVRESGEAGLSNDPLVQISPKIVRIARGCFFLTHQESVT